MPEFTLQNTRTTTTTTEAAWIVAICFGWAILASTQSVAAGFQSASFSDDNMQGLIGMELLFGALALLVLHLRGYAVRSLYPAPSLAGVGVAVCLYVASLMASWIAVAFFDTGPSPQPIDTLVSTATVSLPSIIAVALVNGAYEEIFLLGFLQNGLRGHGLSVALGVSLLVRVLYHLYQGPLGAVSVLAFGLVFGLFYARTHALFPVVFAHVIADVIPFI